MLKHHTKIAVAGIAAGFSTLAVLASATWASGSDLIYACRQKNNGQVRIVDNPGDCRNSEETISWRQRGERGEKGEKGERGERGQRGERGPVDVRIEKETKQARAGDERLSVSVFCDGDEVALGGGFALPDGKEPEGRVVESRPESDEHHEPSGWTATVVFDERNSCRDATKLTAFVICAEKSVH